MEPYQSRVVAEKDELDENYSRLASFVNGDTFQKLPEAERERLTRQLRIMGDYSAVLGERIAAW